MDILNNVRRQVLQIYTAFYILVILFTVMCMTPSSFKLGNNALLPLSLLIITLHFMVTQEVYDWNWAVVNQTNRVHPMNDFEGKRKEAEENVVIMPHLSFVYVPVPTCHNSANVKAQLNQHHLNLRIPF